MCIFRSLDGVGGRRLSNMPNATRINVDRPGSGPVGDPSARGEPGKGSQRWILDEESIARSRAKKGPIEGSVAHGNCSAAIGAGSTIRSDGNSFHVRESTWKRAAEASSNMEANPRLAARYACS